MERSSDEEAGRAVNGLPNGVLEAAVDAVGDAVFITDREGTIQYVNPAFERLTGYTATEALGRTPRILNGGQHPPAFYERLWARLVSGRPFYGDFVNRRKDGTLFQQEATISAFPNEAGRPKHFITVARDVTEKRLTDRWPGGVQGAEVLRVAAAGIAHDCRNVMGVIQGHTELALLAISQGRDATSDLAEVLEAVERGTHILNSLLNLGWKSEVEVIRTPIDELFRGMTPTIRDMFPENVEVVVEMEPGITARVDPSSLDRIILNVAANARDAMPEGGRLTVRGSRVESSGMDRTRDGGAGAPSVVQIEIADTGVGMDEDTLRRIFQPFFTTKPGGRASGLGLTMVGRLVEANRGAVTVRSAPGEGTLVRLCFPSDGEDVRDPGVRAPASRVAAGTGRDCP